MNIDKSLYFIWARIYKFGILMGLNPDRQKTLGFRGCSVSQSAIVRSLFDNYSRLAC